MLIEKRLIRERWYISALCIYVIGRSLLCFSYATEPTELSPEKGYHAHLTANPLTLLSALPQTCESACRDDVVRHSLTKINTDLCFYRLFLHWQLLLSTLLTLTVDFWRSIYCFPRDPLHKTLLIATASTFIVTVEIVATRANNENVYSVRSISRIMTIL